jgi:hypothetical protein
MRDTVNNPAVSLLDEIEEQAINPVGGDVPSPSITSLSCMGVSWGLGNDGWQCTVTVECQASC